MKNLFSILSICLFFTSFQSMANRPAEDESTKDFEPQITDSTPNRAAQETDTAAPETVTTPELAEKTITKSMPASGVISAQPAEDKAQFIIIDFPLRGMDMSKVLNELGEPSMRYPAIGKPPISRWVYPDRTVFFEYSHVIHVVAQ